MYMKFDWLLSLFLFNYKGKFDFDIFVVIVIIFREDSDGVGCYFGVFYG